MSGHTPFPVLRQGLSRPQRRRMAREVEVQARLAKESAAESKLGAKESILADPGKLPHPIGAHRLFAVLNCDFCGAPAGNSDGFGPVCYLCWNAIYQSPSN
jgi:hypothetical protein